MSIKSDIFKKNLSPMTVSSLRLVTGEEVIARINEINENSVVIEQPRVLIAQLRQKPDGTPFMAAEILNWMNANPETAVEVSLDDVIAVVAVDSVLENEYIRFTTGIELASSNKKIIT
jgi:hypothetical protein